MSPRLRRRAWLGICGGAAMYGAMLWAAHNVQYVAFHSPFPAELVGVSLISASLTSVVLFIWGCRSYALAKGRNPIWGYIGFLHIFGLLILILLRDQHPERQQEIRGFEVLPGKTTA